MKKSEELRQKASEEENDFKYMGIANKAVREERNENFEEKWLQKIMTHPDVLMNAHDEVNGRYTFGIKGIGALDFYPKANNLLIRKQNKWKKPGLKWLINKLKL